MRSPFDSAEFNGTLFFPQEDEAPPPEGAKDFRVPVPDGALNLRLHAAAGAPFRLLLFHGNGETAPDYDAAAPSFEACGAALAVMDYRGYGRSEGRPDYRSTLKLDARAAAAALATLDPRPLIIMGRSLGSACLAELYPDPPEGTAGFIWESGYTDLRALLHRRGMTPPAAFGPEDLADFDPLPRLGRGTMPFLALHGEEDVHIDPADSRAAFEAAGTDRKALILVPGRGHTDVMRSERYWQAVRTFLVALQA